MPRQSHRSGRRRSIPARNSLAIAPNNSLLGVCSGGKLTLFNVETGAVDSIRTAVAPIRAVAFQRNHHEKIAYGGDSCATVIEQNGAIVKTLTAPLPIRWLDFEPAGRLLAIAHGHDNSASNVQRWPAESTSFDALFDQKTGPFSTSSNAYAFSKLLHRIAVGTRTGGVAIF